MTTADILPNTLKALRLIRSSAPRGMRMPEAFYGPQVLWLRKEIIELVTGKKPLAKSAGYNAARDLLIKTLGATGNCNANVDADLEARASALLDVPAAQTESPLTEGGEAKNPPPQAMAKIKPTVPTAVPVGDVMPGAPTAAPAEANSKPAKKTSCPITREQFTSALSSMGVMVHDGQGERHFVATRKEFSTGSLGWNANEKITISINGVLCKAQVGLNITLIGSKELPK